MDIDMGIDTLDTPSFHRSSMSNIIYIMGADPIDGIDYEEQHIQNITSIYRNYIEIIYTFIRTFF
jgi:hypothetical protein